MSAVVLDAARLVLSGVSLLLAGFHVRLYRLSVTAGQRARFAGTGLALAMVAVARAERLGGPATWHLPASAVLVALLAYGAYSFDRLERPTSLRRAPGER